MEKTLYNILGITSDASLAEIKKAYHLLAKKYHPDVNKDTAALFREVNEAYTTLSNEDERERYDYELKVKEAEELEQRIQKLKDELEEDETTDLEEYFDEQEVEIYPTNKPILYILNHYNKYTFDNMMPRLCNSSHIGLFFTWLIYTLTLIIKPILKIFGKSLKLNEKNEYKSEINTLVNELSYSLILMFWSILTVLLSVRIIFYGMTTYIIYVVLRFFNII